MVSVPVWFMEPFTTLQKMAEIMEHSEYLDLASRYTLAHSHKHLHKHVSNSELDRNHF